MKRNRDHDAVAGDLSALPRELRDGSSTEIQVLERDST